MDWRKLTPAEVLEQNVALTLNQTAFVLGLCHRKGARKDEPNRRLVLDLVRSGRLPLIDPEQPITRWTVASESVRRYLAASVEAAAS